MNTIAVGVDLANHSGLEVDAGQRRTYRTNSFLSGTTNMGWAYLLSSMPWQSASHFSKRD